MIDRWALVKAHVPHVLMCSQPARASQHIAVFVYVPASPTKHIEELNRDHMHLHIILILSGDRSCNTAIKQVSL